MCNIPRFSGSLFLIFFVLQIFGASCFTKEDCFKGVENGPIACQAYIPVFKWDNEAQKCVSAIYGGCRATNNNFDTIEECQKVAVPICKNTKQP